MSEETAGKGDGLDLEAESQTQEEQQGQEAMWQEEKGGAWHKGSLPEAVTNVYFQKWFYNNNII